MFGPVIICNFISMETFHMTHSLKSVIETGSEIKKMSDFY